MMTLRSILPALQAEVSAEEDLDRTFGTIIASDLMSDVLMVDDEDALLVTSLASDQAVRTAQVIGAAGVVLVNGKEPPPSMVKLSRSLPLNLLTSPLTKYQACVALHQHHATASTRSLNG